MTGAPIFQVFVVREGIGHYRFFAHPAKLIPRTTARAGVESLRPYMEEFGGRLAEVARQYPFQWFNIYPYWD
jgi:predicted LPLAT superfamily acyltransferase